MNIERIALLIDVEHSLYKLKIRKWLKRLDKDSQTQNLQQISFTSLVLMNKVQERLSRHPN